MHTTSGGTLVSQPNERARRRDNLTVIYTEDLGLTVARNCVDRISMDYALMMISQCHANAEVLNVIMSEVAY